MTIINNVMRLTDGTTPIDFRPSADYEVPENRVRSVQHTLDGTLYIYEWGFKRLDEVPIMAMTEADADVINGWWQDLEELSFYYDYPNNPSTYVTAVIVNETRPLQMLMTGRWRRLYYGTLLIREA